MFTKEDAMKLLDKNYRFYILEEVSEESRDDEELVYAAIDDMYYNISFASKRLMNDKEFCLKLIREIDIDSFRYMSKEIQRDKDIFVEVLKSSFEDNRYSYYRILNIHKWAKTEVLRNDFGLSNNKKKYVSKSLKKNSDNIKIVLEELEDRLSDTKYTYFKKMDYDDFVCIFKEMKKNNFGIQVL